MTSPEVPRARRTLDDFATNAACLQCGGNHVNRLVDIQAMQAINQVTCVCLCCRRAWGEWLDENLKIERVKRALLVSGELVRKAAEGN